MTPSLNVALSQINSSKVSALENSPVVLVELPASIVIDHQSVMSMETITRLNLKTLGLNLREYSKTNSKMPRMVFIIIKMMIHSGSQ